jgi:hypothetical protein
VTTTRTAYTIVQASGRTKRLQLFGLLVGAAVARPALTHATSVDLATGAASALAAGHFRQLHKLFVEEERIIRASRRTFRYPFDQRPFRWKDAER